jgi:hypothetical protein
MRAHFNTKTMEEEVTMQEPMNEFRLVGEAHMTTGNIDKGLEYHLDKSNKELLKGWDLSIEHLDYGVIVRIGCKRLAFSSAEEATAEVTMWMTDPKAALKKWFKNLHE